MIEKRISRISLEWMRKIGFLCIILLAIFPGTSLAASTNIVINSGFDLGTAPWVFYTNGAGKFLNDASAGHITISQPGTNVQLYQAGLVLEPNAQYKMSFKAYSNTGHDLLVSLIKHGSPYTNYGLSNYVINLGTSWSEYSIQFKTSGFSVIVKDARLFFGLAPYDAAGDQYFLDNVILAKVSSDTPVQTPPTITTQPSSKTVSAGQTATFMVAATSTTLSYQWQRNGVSISGATGATYTIPATTLSNSGTSYRVVVSNNVGSATSNAATLTVVSAPSNKQLVILDVFYEHNTTIYHMPYISGKSANFFNIPSNVPYNLVSPIDYAHGTIYQRLEVFTKPSTRIVKYQICLFQDTIIQTKHACTNRDQLAFTSTGTYYQNQPFSSIFQYGNIDWRRKLLIIMLDMTDKNGILLDDRSGYNFNRQWDGYQDMSLYYPMKIRYTAIAVPSGGGAPVWP